MQLHTGFEFYFLFFIFFGALALLSPRSSAVRLMRGWGDGKGRGDTGATLHRLQHGLPPRGNHGRAICLTAKEWAKSISVLPSWTDDRLLQCDRG